MTNESGKTLESFYYNIDYIALQSLPANTRHFHAQFRRQNPTAAGQNYVILETKGAGQYVGTALFMAGRSLRMLEGNEMIYLDGSVTPSIEGTGTEDYFSSGWYFDRGVYSAPYHGVVIKEQRPARISAYRWHIEDVIPFSRSIRFTIEHGAQNTEQADYSSVAYYYLLGPSPRPEPLPSDLLPSHMVLKAPMTIPGVIEAENLKGNTSVTSGYADSGYMDLIDAHDVWSNGQVLWWAPADDDGTAELTIQLPAGVSGRYEVIARFATGPDLGIVQLASDAESVAKPIDLWAPDWVPREASLGVVSLRAGANPLMLKVIGKNAQSKGRGLGIDGFVLKALQ